MAEEKPTIKNLSSNIKHLSEISDWFEGREDIDLEEGLQKIKEAAELIKISKKRLSEIKNEFEEIKKDVEVKDNARDEDEEEIE